MTNILSVKLNTTIDHVDIKKTTFIHDNQHCPVETQSNSQDHGLYPAVH